MSQRRACTIRRARSKGVVVMRPVVSVIIPTFDRLAYLPVAIQSVYSQSFTDWEVVIADDGSTGETRDYLRTLNAPPRVRVLYLDRNSGIPAVPRNAALRIAIGDFVAFLDSDDIWLPAKLERQVASLRRHPDRRWSYTDFSVIDATGAVLRSSGQTRAVLTGGIIEPLLNDETVIATSCVIVERQLISRLGMFDETFSICEDDDMWFRLAVANEVDSIDEPLTLKRRHSQNYGDDVSGWRNRRRVFEKMIGANTDLRLGRTLRRRRAEMSAGLARSQASAGRRLGALWTVVTSAPYSCKHAGWWHGAMRAVARAILPGAYWKLRGARADRGRRS